MAKCRAPQISPEICEIIPAMELVHDNYYCKRCGQLSVSFLPKGIAYCRACLGLGRITAKDYLVRIKTTQKFLRAQPYLTWAGTLTPAQAQVSQALCESLRRRKSHLVHAVTGAGKTEMMFAVVDQALAQGLRICWATPRIDVVNELFPRLQAAFTNLKIGKYHGKEYCEPQFDQLCLCTTHQLLKFYHAFDVIVIDEVDAFPYQNSAMLHFGAAQALQPTGISIYLTATPTAAQLALVAEGKINYSCLKRRFHGGLLPVPEVKFLIRPTLTTKAIHPVVVRQLAELVAAHQPIMIFVPRIKQLAHYQELLTAKFPQIKIASVYAGDKKRLAKIQAFREGKLDLLLTTTILERGVTIKHVQVLVLDADDQIYNCASLVQIAGRVGRAAGDPTGKIIFYYHQYTTAMQQAVRQIKEMNRD